MVYTPSVVFFFLLFSPSLCGCLLCVLGFLAGIIYTTNAGLYFLDVVDHFVTNISLIVIGILECVAVGWIFGAEKMRKGVARQGKEFVEEHTYRERIQEMFDIMYGEAKS